MILTVISYLKVIIIPVAVALLLTVLVQPFTRFLRTRLHFSVPLAAATGIVALIGGVTALAVIAGREIASGLTDLSAQAVIGFEQLLGWLSDGPLAIDSATIDTYWQELLGAAQSNSSSLVSGALSVTTTVGQVLAGAIIALFCTLFFLIDGRRIWTWIVGLLPRHTRERVHQAGRRGLVTLASYVRTQILVAFIDAVGISLGAAIIGVPLAVPLGVLVFIGAFIPFVGAIITGSIAILVALVANGWVAALIMTGVVLLVQQIEGNVLQPWLMGQAVSLHPVAVLLAVTTGALVAGIVGALFAVPLVAVLNTVILYFHGHDKFPELGFDDHIALRPSGRRAIMIMSAERHVGMDTGWEPEVRDEEESLIPPRLVSTAEAGRAAFERLMALRSRSMKDQSSADETTTTPNEPRTPNNEGS
ncbi:AI-2E family transporter [Sanguibacter antarcticus]|uniref:AI-2E family transporter n=1 Tax=Sanguibacter antarcticus TaxID=372484 RepID=UPI001FE8A194|nr:AI-2E family transporter [Sanguibacter antarcticus]